VVKEVKAMYLVKTKGMEGVKVPIRDKETIRWYESVARFFGKTWRYLKVRPYDLETHKPRNFKTLATATLQRL